MLTHQNKRDELYNLNLREIGGISFTQREIDVLACIVVHNRSEKMIASILSVSPRTIGTHTSNIMKKLGNSTRENIQNIAKKSGKLAYIREYYVHLRVYSMFIKVLQYVGKNLIRQNLNLIVNGSVSKESAYNELKKYLEIANINLEFSGSKSKTSYQAVAVYDSNKSEKEAIYLQFEEHISDDEKHNEYVNLYDPDVFYFSVLKLVKFFVDSPRLNKYIDDFHAEYKSIISLSIAMPEISDLQSKDVVSTRGIVQFSTVIFLVLVFIFLLQNNIVFTQREVIKSDMPLISSSIMIDRKDLLLEMDEKIKSSNPIGVIFLLGIEGSGKTTLARKYASSYSKADVIWEINAESKNSLVKSYNDLAYRLCTNENDINELNIILEDKNQKTKLLAVRSFILKHLERYDSWLFIYEDMNSFDELRRFIPSVSEWRKGAVIINTRNANIQSNHHIHKDNIVKVGTLNDQEKYNLFTNIVGGSHYGSDNVKSFLKNIPPFPLDITVSAYYIKEEKIPYSEYIDVMNVANESVVDIQEDIMRDVGVYKKTRLGILVSSIQKINSINTDFKDLLFFCSLINSESISKELLLNFKDEKVVNDFIFYLKEFSLINIESQDENNEIKSFSILATSQVVIKNYLKQLLSGVECKKIAKSAVNTFKQYFDNNNNTIEKEKNLVFYKHIESLIKNRELIEPKEVAYFSRLIGVYYVANENCERAKNFLKESLDWYNRDESVYSAEIAEISVNLGELYLFIGEYESANQFLHVARKIYSKNIKNNECALSWTYALLGYNFRAVEHYKQAEIYLTKSLSLHKECRYLSKKARILGYLGSVHRNLGNYDTSLNFLIRSNNLIIDTFGEDHFRKYWIDNYLGQVYLCQGRYMKAVKFIESSALNYLKKFGNKDSRTIWAHTWLGSLKGSLGQFEEASDILNKSYVRFKKLYPSKHLTIAWCSNLLGNIYRQLGDYNLAMHHLEEAQEIFAAKLGKNSIKGAWNLINLGLLYRDQNELDKAEKYLEKALNIYYEKNGHDHKRTAEAMAELGYTKFLQGHVDEGEKMIEEALEVMTKIDHSNRFTMLLKLADINKDKLNKYELSADEKNMLNDQILKYMNSALDIVSSELPPDSYHAISTKQKIQKYLEINF